MITDLIIHISNFILHTINNLGLAGVVILMAIESAAIPLPSEIIMPFAGFLAASGRFGLIGLGLAGALGSVIGSSITYALGYYGGRKLIQKYGHWVWLSQKELDLTERFYYKFKHWANFLGRVVPIVRTFISIPAGIARTPFIPFVFASFIGSFIWSVFLAWLGLKLGENWKILEVYFRRFDTLIIIGVVLIIGYWVTRHLKRGSQQG